MRLLILAATLLASVIGAVAYHTQATRMIRAEIKAEAFSAMGAMSLGCTREKRLDDSEISYKVGCLLAAIRICGSMQEPEKFGCYSLAQKECEFYAPRYRAWLNTGK